MQEITQKQMFELASIIAEQLEASVLSKTAHGRWLKITQACKYAQMSKNTLMECIADGEIKAKKRKKGGWIVDRCSIDEYNGHNGEDMLYNDIARRTIL